MFGIPSQLVQFSSVAAKEQTTLQDLVLEQQSQRKIGAPQFVSGSKYAQLRVTIDPDHKGHTKNMRERDLFRTPAATSPETVRRRHQKTKETDAKLINTKLGRF